MFGLKFGFRLILQLWLIQYVWCFRFWFLSMIFDYHLCYLGVAQLFWPKFIPNFGFLLIIDITCYQWYLITIGVIWEWPKFFSPKLWIFRTKFIPKFGFQLIFLSMIFVFSIHNISSISSAVVQVKFHLLSIIIGNIRKKLVKFELDPPMLDSNK